MELVDNKRKIYIMYHGISNHKSDSIYIMDKVSFREQMQYLSNLIAEDKLSSEIVITFDDGHKSDIDVALPILKAFNLKAFFFIITSRIGNEKSMDWDDVQKLVDEGMVIGSHTISHRALTALTEQELYDEVIGSKKILENKLGIPIDKISCPGGFYNEKAIELMINNGYKEVYTSDIGIVKDRCNTTRIPRIIIKSHYSLKKFNKIIQYNNLLSFRLVIEDKIKRFIKKHISSQTYSRLVSYGKKVLRS